MKGRYSLSAALIFGFGLSVASAADDSAGATVDSFLRQHCLRCHGPESAERDLRVDTLSRDFQSGRDGHLWGEILERINAGEMPPDSEPQPSEDEIAGAVEALNGLLVEGRAARMAARPRIAHYRLSRREYQNTIYDLLGVRYDATRPGELNADPLWQGYERLGAQLTLSPSHMERYYSAAQTVLDRALPAIPAETRRVRKSAADLRYRGGVAQQKYLDRFGITRPLRALVFPGRLQQALRSSWLGRIGPEASGLYRLRMQVSGVRPSSGQIPHLRIGKRLAEATNEGLIELDVTASEDNPQIIEREVFLEMPADLDFNVVVSDIINRDKGGHHRNILASDSYIFTHTSETRLLNPTGPKLFDEDGQGIFSFVLLDWIEWEGPLETESERLRKRRVQTPESASPDEVAARLQSFASLAWRRPVTVEEVLPYRHAWQLDREAGGSDESAWKTALSGILTSRHFLYLVEGDLQSRDELNDWELASRLSYFLWSTMPDEDLIRRLNQGTLSASGWAAEVDRMLADPKMVRFCEDFARQWLQLHRLGMFPPDGKLYPDYDVWLEASMREEVLRYFRVLFQENRPIDELIASDWTIANARLSEFYGLPEPESAEFQRVGLPASAQRGGLLTSGAVLGLTSDGTRHRPVHRGVWVSEVVFGKTPPPPPANVDPIAPNASDRPRTTIRQKINAHATNPNCAACHRGIDPLGLAFEQFDAVGRWRTTERVRAGTGQDPPVDPSGVLPDGREFLNAEEFKRLILEDREAFTEAFIEHLMTYGLRRVMTVDDRLEIRELARQWGRPNVGLKDLVRAVALSDLFRRR